MILVVFYTGAEIARHLSHDKEFLQRIDTLEQIAVYSVLVLMILRLLWEFVRDLVKPHNGTHASFVFAA
jgi:hypothetical protein